jgi:hypothetical protein
MEIQPVQSSSLLLQQLRHTIPRIPKRWTIQFHSGIKERLETGQKSFSKSLVGTRPSSKRNGKTMATQRIKIKNKGLFLIGIILLVLGMVLSLYHISGGVMQTTYPYQTVGIILVVIGIVCTVLGFFYSPHYLITAFERKRAQGN